LNIEDDDHNLNCLLNNYYDDNDGKTPLDAFHIDSNYYGIEQISTTVLENTQNFKYYTMHFNIRSLPNKFRDIKMYRHCIMLCETFLIDNNYVFDAIPGYKLTYRNRQTGSRGGVAMYIRDDLNYIIRDDISVNIDGKFESIFVEAHSKTVNCIFGEIYRVLNTSEILSISYYETI
jgi:hypothetical protein